MSFYADLHIHSKYSRACSRDCDLEHLAWWAGRKGVTVVGTGDFTHPAWLRELEETLVPAEPGLFRLRDDLGREVSERLPPACRGPVRFLLSVEISTIYKRADRTRKVHHLVYAPDFATVRAFNRALGRIGNLGSDGRPILGLDSRDLLEIVLESGEGAYLVPAHVWTPWFAVLGSMSGFDAVADCYADLADHVFAVETGLSSDPAMNWRVSGLDRYRLVSNSDAHSPPMLGREATVFSGDLDYPGIRRSLETGEGFDGTVEFFPEEGKYHLDGHRKCGVRALPSETRTREGLCSGCGKPVTVGVMHRVETLADRADGHRPAGAAGFRSLVPLPEILSEILRVGPKSKAVGREVARLVDRLGPELGILEQVPTDEIRPGWPLVAEAIDRLREGRVLREAGYDGEYGVIRMFAPGELDGPATYSLFPPDAAAAEAPGDARSDAAAAAAPPGVGSAQAQPALVAVTAGRDGSGDGTGPAAAAAVRSEAGSDAPAADDLALVDDGPGTGSPLLAGLDAQQRAAASVSAGPLLIVAGPGTGKTRTLTHRLAALVRDHRVAPERCLALTFTRRACAELQERLDGLLGETAARMTVTTFHGLGLTLIREQHEALGLPSDVRVADEAERLALLRVRNGGPATAARRLLAELSAHRRSGDGHAPVLERYTAALRARGLVDFDDLAALPVHLLEDDDDLRAGYRRRWTHVSVDEYQDVDALQYRLLRTLVPADGNLCAIGDPDQAIYGFRGGDVGFFLRFLEDFPGARRVQLARNYRSSATIVKAALQAVAPQTLVPDRALQAVAGPSAPAPVVLHQASSERGEAEFVVATIERLLGGSSHFSFDSGRVEEAGDQALSFADFAVLARTSAQMAPLAEALQRAGMPFQQRSHDRLLDRPAVEVIVARLRAAGAEQPSLDGLAATVADQVRGAATAAAAEVTRARRTGGGAAPAAGGPEAHHDTASPGTDALTAAELDEAVDLLDPLAQRCGRDLERFLTELSLGAEVDTWDPRADRISLLTLHAAKGLEFPVVFVTGCEDGLLPLRWGSDTETAAAEERRLFFVGMTRARTRLLLSRSARRLRHGAVVDSRPSPYLGDLDPALLDCTGPHLPSRPRPALPTVHQLQLL